MKKFRHLKPVIKWWVIFCLVVFTTGYLHITIDLFTMINADDVTKISFLLIGVLYAYLISFGVRLSKFCNNVNNEYHMTRFVRTLKHGWFLSNIFAAFGFVGTIIGIRNMLNISGLSSDAFASASIGSVVSGMQTAMMTTLVALIGAIIIKCTLYLIENDIEIIEYDNDCKFLEE